MRVWIITALVAGVAVAGGVTASSSAQGQNERKDQTIVVYEKTGSSTFHYVDAKPFTRIKNGLGRRVSPGDAVTVKNSLFSDAAGKVRVGTLYAHCVAPIGARRFSRARFICNGTARFPDGDLNFEGFDAGGNDSGAFGIGSGTRAYEGARGQLTLEVLDGGLQKDTIHLLPN